MLLYCRRCNKDTEHNVRAFEADEMPSSVPPKVLVTVDATCEECEWDSYSGADWVEIYID